MAADVMVESATVERRDIEQTADRFIGHVVSCDGAFALIHAKALDISNKPADFWSIGRLISIEVGAKRIVGLVFKMDLLEGGWVHGTSDTLAEDRN